MLGIKGEIKNSVSHKSNNPVMRLSTFMTSSKPDCIQKTLSLNAITLEVMLSICTLQVVTIVSVLELNWLYLILTGT